MAAFIKRGQIALAMRLYIDITSSITSIAINNKQGVQRKHYSQARNSASLTSPRLARVSATTLEYQAILSLHFWYSSTENLVSNALLRGYCNCLIAFVKSNSIIMEEFWIHTRVIKIWLALNMTRISTEFIFIGCIRLENKYMKILTSCRSILPISDIDWIGFREASTFHLTLFIGVRRRPRNYLFRHGWFPLHIIRSGPIKARWICKHALLPRSRKNGPPLPF